MPLWPRGNPERESQLDDQVLRFLGIIHEGDGRGAAHSLVISGAFTSGAKFGDPTLVPLGKVKEKEVERAARRLAEKELVRVDELGDVYITEKGVEQAAELNAAVRARSTET